VSSASGISRSRSIVGVRRKGSAPPALIKISPNMFVATATRGSTPKSSMAGTVTSEVLPVTTPTALVTNRRIESVR
jgi:hypothetical protein